MEYKENELTINIFTVTAVALLFSMMVLTIPRYRGKFTIQMGRVYNKAMNYTPIRYCGDDLTPVSKRRLQLVARKTLVLDMDDTLIKSYIEYESRGRVKASMKKKPLIAYDCCFQMPSGNVTVYVYKRPHVDYFLDRVSKWYNLTVFTAATEGYASRVLDYLDGGRNILSKRLYRDQCIDIYGIRAKFLSMCNQQMNNVILLDDCHTANSFNEGNAICIKPYVLKNRDTELLSMLPFLDALRFTRDVRSILGRCNRYGHLTRDLLFKYHYYT